MGVSRSSNSKWRERERVGERGGEDRERGRWLCRSVTQGECNAHLSKINEKIIVQLGRLVAESNITAKGCVIVTVVS